MAVCLSCNAWIEGEPPVCPFCKKPIEAPRCNSVEDTLVVKGSVLENLPKAQRTWSSAEVGKYPEIELRCNGKSCKVKLKENDPVILGRVDAGFKAKNPPDVNLAEFGAFDKGVSRQHAALRLDGSMLMVQDIDSTNGTFVNGQRVTGTAGRVVRDQDELRLGSLSLTLNFNTTAPLKDFFKSDGTRRPQY